MSTSIPMPQRWQPGLSAAVSIFTAEMYAVKTTMEEELENSEVGNYTIFSMYCMHLLVTSLGTKIRLLYCVLTIGIGC